MAGSSGYMQTQHAGECVPAAPREVQVTIPRTVQRTEMVPETVMVPRYVEEPAVEVQHETVMRERSRMVPKTIMVEEKYEAPEVIQKQVPKMVERTIEETIMVPETRHRTVMVPQIVDETVMVPKVVPRTVMERAMVTRTEMVPETVMKPQCIEDHYEETRVLRFDPITGQQIDSGYPQHSPAHGASSFASVPRSPRTSSPHAPIRGSVKSPHVRHKSPSRVQLPIGQKIRARYRDGKMYTATVVDYVAGDAYSVQWYDGTYSQTVPAELCEPMGGHSLPYTA